jgi:hypothetical protein
MLDNHTINLFFACFAGTIACSFPEGDNPDRGKQADTHSCLDSQALCDTETGQQDPLLLSVVLETPEKSPLTRRVTVRLREPAAVRFEYWQEDGHRFERAFSQQTVEQQWPLVGLVAGQKSHLLVHVERDGEQVQSEMIEFQTTPLDVELPIVVSEGSDETPNGRMLLFAVKDPEGESVRQFWGVDRRGEVVWTLDTSEFPPVTGATIDPVEENLFLYRAKGSARFVNAYGEMVSQIGLSFKPSHDVALLPNGNVITVEKNRASRNLEDWGEVMFVWDVLKEVNPAGEVVWSWDSAAYLDVNRIPEGTEPRNEILDWSHVNSVEYIEETDQLLISVRHQNWVLLVDHKTGEVLWRLGHGGDFSLSGGVWFKGQHDATLQNDGSVLVFDNGNLRSAEVPSRAARYQLDTENQQAELVWSYNLDHAYSSLGSVRTLAGGETIIAAGGKRSKGVPLEIFELDAMDEKVWSMSIEDATNRSLVYRAVPYVYADVIPADQE